MSNLKQWFTIPSTKVWKYQSYCV